MDALADYLKQNHDPAAAENKRQLPVRTTEQKEPEVDRGDFRLMTQRLTSWAGNHNCERRGGACNRRRRARRW